MLATTCLNGRVPERMVVGKQRVDCAENSVERETRLVGFIVGRSVLAESHINHYLHASGNKKAFLSNYVIYISPNFFENMYEMTRDEYTLIAYSVCDISICESM